MVRKGLLLPFEAAGREDDEADDDEAEHDELGGRRALVEEEYAADAVSYTHLTLPTNSRV